MKLNSGMFVAALTSLLSLPMPSAASLSNASKKLWRIGVFNASSGEFRSQDIDYADPKSDPVYVVGKSSERDWLRFQPGPANGMTGGRLHSSTIQFGLSDQPHGVFRLHLAVLYETPRLSHLRIAGSQSRRRNR
jgi:hypothetical protein